MNWYIGFMQCSLCCTSCCPFVCPLVRPFDWPYEYIPFSVIKDLNILLYTPERVKIFSMCPIGSGISYSDISGTVVVEELDS